MAHSAQPVESAQLHLSRRDDIVVLIARTSAGRGGLD